MAGDDAFMGEKVEGRDLFGGFYTSKSPPKTFEDGFGRNISLLVIRVYVVASIKLCYMPHGAASCRCLFNVLIVPLQFISPHAVCLKVFDLLVICHYIPGISMECLKPLSIVHVECH